MAMYCKGHLALATECSVCGVFAAAAERLTRRREETWRGEMLAATSGEGKLEELLARSILG